MPPKPRPPYVSRFSEILDDDAAKENISTLIQETNPDPESRTLHPNTHGMDDISVKSQETGHDNPHLPLSEGSNEDGGVALEPHPEISDSLLEAHLKEMDKISADSREKPQPGPTKQISDEKDYLPHADILIGKHTITCQTGGLKTGQSSNPRPRYKGYIDPKDWFIKKACYSCTLEYTLLETPWMITTSTPNSLALPFFISSRGNEYFCEIDEDYLNDRFNLTGLNTEVQNYQYALDLITDVFDLDCDDEVREHIDKSARHLYGLVHARYIVTTRGLSKMVRLPPWLPLSHPSPPLPSQRYRQPFQFPAQLEKYKKSDFGKCPRVMCDAHPLLPMGMSDTPSTKSVKLYCAKCEDIYNPKSSRHASIDGAYFGTSFHNILFQVYPALVPEKSRARHEPKVFGFKVHAAASLARWQDEGRREMRRRLGEAGVGGEGGKGAGGVKFVEDGSQGEEEEIEGDESFEEGEGEGEGVLDEENEGIEEEVLRIEAAAGAAAEGAATGAAGGNAEGAAAGVAGGGEAMQDVVEEE
ncbi:MAG: hypothetical protein Q9160_003982 [Pyrenula sp. 1 TL-2023]